MYTRGIDRGSFGRTTATGRSFADDATSLWFRGEEEEEVAEEEKTDEVHAVSEQRTTTTEGEVVVCVSCESNNVSPIK